MCTASGRKAAQEGLSAERRAPSRMVSKSKFIGGYAALGKRVGDVETQTTHYAERGDGGVTETTYRPSQRTWTGQSGRVYGVRAGSTMTDPGGGEAGTDPTYDRFSYVGMQNTPRVGTEIMASANTKDNPLRNMGFAGRISTFRNMSAEERAAHDTKYKNYNVGSTTARKGGIKISSEEEARATYKDFGMDFDKDEYRGEFYKTTQGLSNQTRINVEAQEGKRRKLNRIRGGAGAGAGGATTGNARRKAKRQGNFRISSAGVQGGSTGGGTTLS